MIVLDVVEIVSAGSAVTLDEATAAVGDGASALQSAGGKMCTMLPHLGQAWISPITSGLRIFSRERQVSQVTRKGCTVDRDLKMSR